jgi:triphosphoribosyl-dephospho-CoA synthase
MDHTVMVASVASLTPWFAVLADAGRRSAGFDEHLRPLGQAAEADMLAATGGVNTHRGAIFGIGMLAAAAGACSPDEGSPEVTPGDLRAALVARWGDALERHERRRRESASHGGSAMRRHHVRGAAGEAAAGFPAVFEIGVPALSGARSLGLDENAARVQALFVLLAEVPDTNVLHRGGADGQDVVRARARRFLDAGGCATEDWWERAEAVHRELVRRWLSPGGCADLLGASLFVTALADGA